MRWLLLPLMLLGCSPGTTTTDEDCERVAAEIRDAAVKRGFDGDGDGQADSKGVCNSKDPAIQKDLGSACLSYQKCLAGR